MRRILLLLVLLTLAALPLAVSAQDVTPIAFGDTVDGELTSSNEAVLYSFEAEAGASVQIRLVSEDFDCYLVLTDADGNVLATDDDGAGSLDSQITFTAAESGEYQVSATSYGAYSGSSGATGSYTLSLAVVEVESIEYGEVINDTISGEPYVLEYQFTAAPGDNVIIRLESDDFDSYLRLRDASGSEIAYNDDGAGNLNSLIGPVALTDGGIYTIVASSLGGSSAGDFVLSLNSAQLESIAVGEPVTGELTPANGVAYYTLDAAAGDVVSIAVEADIDTNVAINDPFNYQIASDEDGGSGNNPELDEVALSNDGTYTIIVGSPFNDVGEFTITVSRAEVPSLNDGPVTLNFDSSGSSRIVAYSGEAGEQVRLTLTSTGGDDISPNVDVKQAGSSVVYGSASAVTEFSIVFAVPDDGDLTVTLNDYSYQSTRVEVRISSAE